MRKLILMVGSGYLVVQDMNGVKNKYPLDANEQTQIAAALREQNMAASALHEADARLLISLDFHVGGKDGGFVITQKIYRQTSGVERAFQFVKKIESIAGLADGALSKTLREICEEVSSPPK